MSVIVGVGHKVAAAFRRNTNSWGGAALALGAGHGIEIDGHSLKSAAELIRNAALGGGVTRLPGVKGNENHSGDIGPCPLYYRGLEVPLALVMGIAGTPTTLTSGAYRHVLKIANADAGKFGTFVVDPFADAEGQIHEFPCVKLTGFKIDWANGQMGKISFMGTPFGVNFNVGSPVTNRIVTSVDVADGTYTIANQPTTPSPLTVTVTDANTSITEHIVTIVGTDRDGNVITEVYTLSTSGLTFTTSNYFKTVTSVTGSGTAGSVGAGVDKIIVGVSNGVNNATSVASITYPSERDFVLFSQLDAALFNLQGDGALTAATTSADNDEYYIESLSLQVTMGHADDVHTSKFGARINEPVRGGKDFAEVTLGIKFRDYDNRNHRFMREQMSKDKMKGSLSFIGPLVGSTAYAHSLKMFFNNLQVNTGTPTLSGPGLMPFDIEMFAQRALSIPTGFTSGYTGALIMELVNSLSTDALT